MMRASSPGASRPRWRNLRASWRWAASIEPPAYTSASATGSRKMGVRHVGVASDHLRQLVEREIDAMVAHAPLGKIIGADALRAVTGADLPSTFGGAGSIPLLTLEVVESGAQDGHGLGAVSVL